MGPGATAERLRKQIIPTRDTMSGEAKVMKTNT